MRAGDMVHSGLEYGAIASKRATKTEKREPQQGVETMSMR